MEENIPFSKLDQATPKFLSSESSKSSKLQLPTPAGISESTLKVLQGLRQAPKIAVALSEKSQANSSDDKLAGNMRAKYSELLAPVRKDLVLPLHMKSLSEMVSYIDQSLNFIKQCRKPKGNILFSDLKASVE